jgi:hypothetical protein
VSGGRFAFTCASVMRHAGSCAATGALPASIRSTNAVRFMTTSSERLLTQCLLAPALRRVSPTLQPRFSARARNRAGGVWRENNSRFGLTGRPRGRGSQQSAYVSALGPARLLMRKPNCALDFSHYNVSHATVRTGTES